jgi:hypothetical protein
LALIVFTLTLVLRNASLDSISIAQSAPPPAAAGNEGDQQLQPRTENPGGRSSTPAPNQLPSVPQEQPGFADLRPADYNSPPSGNRIQGDIGTSGRGKLTVKNGTDKDAVVLLSKFTTGQRARWFFVRSGDSAQVGKIPAGVYRLSFTTGLDWVESATEFGWQASYREFDRTFEFNEKDTPEGIEFEDLTVTLHPVVFGNVRTRPISREEFLKGNHEIALVSEH